MHVGSDPLTLNFRGSRESSLTPGACRQAGSRHCSSRAMVGGCPGRGEAVTVSKAVLVVATWRELLSRQAGGH